jgi:(DL)-glycerol-3-phosphatase
VQQNICARYGKEFTWELKAKMMGRKALAASQILIDELELGQQLTAAELVLEREKALHSMFPHCKVLPGAHRLLEHLKRSGVPICVATSSHRRHFDLKTTNHGELFKLFDHIVTGDMVVHGKPAPDIFQVAAEQWSPMPAPKTCLVFEDAPFGVQAALAAGMQVVMVPDANLDRSETKGAHEVLTTLLDFVPEKYGLPPYAS